MRIVTPSTIEGPSPARARATASATASCTASTSVPSTVTPGMPYATALIENDSELRRQVQRRGVGVLVVLDHEHVGQLLHAGERERLVEVGPRRRAVTAERQAHPVLAAVLRRERHPRGHREVGRDVAGQVVDVQVQPPVVQGAVPAAGGRGGLAHEARHHLPGLHAPPQVRAEVAVDRGQVVVGAQRRSGTHADRLVPVPGVERTEQVAALVHGDHAVLDRPGEHHDLVDAPQQLRVAVGDGRRGRRFGRCVLAAGAGGHGAYSPRKKSRTSRLKSAVRSIMDQCPQCENTARSALSISSSSL